MHSTNLHWDDVVRRDSDDRLVGRVRHAVERQRRLTCAHSQSTAICIYHARTHARTLSVCLSVSLSVSLSDCTWHHFHGGLKRNELQRDSRSRRRRESHGQFSV
jgi:hypothetical protein